MKVTNMITRCINDHLAHINFTKSKEKYLTEYITYIYQVTEECFILSPTNLQKFSTAKSLRISLGSI